MNDDMLVKNYDSTVSYLAKAGVELDLASRRLKRAERGLLFPSLFSRTNPRAKGDAVAWISMLHIVECFVARNGRLPSRRSADSLERSFAGWIARTRRSELLSAYARARMQVSPAFQRTAHEQQFSTMFGECIVWVHKHGSLPRVNRADANETRLARWFNRALAARRNLTATASRAEAVEMLLDVAREVSRRAA